MREQKIQQFRDVGLAYQTALHALREYRMWRDNAYIGQHMGEARTSYVAILRRRVKDAVGAYRLVRNVAQAQPQRRAA